jgi:isopentenyl-diphosphate delta-isomerase type 1
MSASTTWDATQTQEDFMRNDRVILVDAQDVVIGDASKKDAHKFLDGGATPTGTLHRAFSVFIFDADDRLLLQQRAASKITFPSVWTNTCCSHQLTGQEPGEIDSPSAIASGSCRGAKSAAVRKLKHELGIDESDVPIDSIKFLTRLHYCAKDEFAEHENQPVGGTWGEHEMDYILFVKVPRVGETLPMDVNADEIDATKWVSASELKSMMDPTSGLRWSPWFRIIAERFLYEWWGDLDAALTTDKYVDVGTIHKVM